MLCFRKMPAAKNFMDKRGGEYQVFPLKFFRLTVPKNSISEPFSHSLISGIEKVWIRGWWGGDCHDFPSKISCLTKPKNAVGEPFSPSLVSGIDKTWIRGGGGEEREYHNFLSKTFCFKKPKIFVGEPPVLCFRKIPAAKMFMDKKGG